MIASFCVMGLEICLGAEMVGRPLRLGPLRREILLRSSDMMSAVSLTRGPRCSGSDVTPLCVVPRTRGARGGRRGWRQWGR